MNIRSYAASFAIGSSLVLAALPSHAQGVVATTLVPSGATKQLGGYRPQPLTLSPDKPASVTKVPADLASPMYGILSFGPKDRPVHVGVIVDEPATGPQRLFVDSNGNGDFTDDPPAKWTARPSKSRDGKDLTMYMGSATIALPDASGKTADATIDMYRFDKTDPQREKLKNVVLYYHEYAREGKLTLGGKSYGVMLDDMATTGDYSNKDAVVLLIDKDGDGHFAGRGHQFIAGKPFNIGGTTYEISKITPDGSSFTVVPSKETVAEIKPLPTFNPGKPALAFSAETTDGKTIAFPTAYKGKLVLLDFWATWCGPCKAELPKLTAAYGQFHDKGFDVLGISLDQKDSGPKLASFTKDNSMPWPQVYDGKFWEARIAQMYGIQAIPAPILVDGDTGTIVAMGDDLRGDQLAVTLAKALAAKK